MCILFENRFHVNSSSSDADEHNCALCLVALPPAYGSKVCKKCYEKHNNHSKHAAFSLAKEADLPTRETPSKSNQDSLPEHHCNLCKKPFSSAPELEEHLIEHSFRGCEERGYNCYICSAIFTLPSGLHQHMIEHGPSYRPYDCNLCAKKFYFRAELENHLIDHESGRISSTAIQTQLDSLSNTSNGIKHEQNQMADSNEDSDSEKEHNSNANIKSEDQQYSTETNAEDDDEYIEVEQIGENVSVNGETNNGNRLKSPEVDDQREASCEKDCLSDET